MAMAIVAVHCNWEGQKAGLFEMVGIVDNTCGKRDRRESTCTSAQFVPAEIETGRKCMYASVAYTCACYCKDNKPGFWGT